MKVGSDGLQHFLDDMYKHSFLKDGGDGKYYATQKANIEDIANKLNLKEQVVIDMFEALKDYGATFDIARSNNEGLSDLLNALFGN